MALILPPSRWRRLGDPELGMLNVLSDSIARAAAADPESLPDLRQARALFVGSDYAGESARSRFDALTFIIADVERLGQWADARVKIRWRLLPDTRRMSYSRLADTHRSEALLPLLRAANSIPGLLASFVIDKRLGHVFTRSGRPNPALVPQFAGWKRGILERLLRVLHFAGLLLAGLSMPGQDVLWVTDNDAIIPNVDRLKDVTELAASISSLYLPHTLGKLRLGTANVDPGDRQVEDLLSVPDLVSGTLVDVFSVMRRESVFPDTVDLAFPASLPDKPRSVLRWLADGEYGKPLKRLTYTVEPGHRAGKVLFKDIRFSGPGLVG